MVIAATAQQSREAYTISARAGGVNFVVGDVRVRRGEATQTLSANDEIASGDMLRTGAGGQLEMLLNPGSYLRLAENSEIELTDSSLDNLRLRIVSGTVIVEATGTGGNERPLIETATPQTSVAIIRDGLYRISVLPATTHTTEVFVRRGRALVIQNAQPVLVRGGKRAIIIGDSLIDVASFNRRNKDAFDLWSRERGETLARENRRLSNRAMTVALAGFGDFNSLFDARRGYYPSGLWVRGTSGCYTYLPFYAGAYSPYGGGYYTSVYFNGAPGTCCGNRGGGQITSGGSQGNQTGGMGSGGNAGGGDGGGSNSPPPAIINNPAPPVRDFPQERRQPIERPGAREIGVPVRDQ